MPKVKKVVEYLINLCYYLNNRERIEVTVMLDAIREIYSKMLDESATTNNKMGFWSSVLYIHKLRRYAKTIDWSLYVEKNPDICGGSAVIKGTRITPEIVLERFKSICNSNEDLHSKELLKKIRQDYPTLNNNDIIMAILYVIYKKGLRALIK